MSIFLPRLFGLFVEHVGLFVEHVGRLFTHPSSFGRNIFESPDLHFSQTFGCTISNDNYLRAVVVLVYDQEVYEGTETDVEHFTLPGNRMKEDVPFPARDKFNVLY